MNQFQTLTIFKKQLLLFMDELIEQFPFESDFKILKIFFQNQIPIETCLNSFKRFLNKNEGGMRLIITARDDAFFFKENYLKFIMSDDKMNHFKKLWFDSTFTVECKNTVWAWIDLFVKIADKPTIE